MASHNEVGKEGEKAAADFLRKEGYTILHTNFMWQKAEIDIIAQKNDVVVAVEVKTRSTLEFGLPQEFVKPKKIQLLVKAINHYIEENDIDAEVRFDIIGIHKNGASYDIDHIIDAFYYF